MPPRRAWDVAVDAHRLLDYSGNPLAAGLTNDEVVRIVDAVHPPAARHGPSGAP